MYKDITVLAVKVILGVFCAEVVLNGVMEILGRDHRTETWIAGIVGSTIALVIGASFKKKD